MSNEITIPAVFVERRDFFKKINENNTKVYSHVEYLRDLVTNMHSMYHQLCKKMILASEEAQRKVTGLSKIKTQHSEVILEFIKSISFLHFSISNQLNSNSVTLGTKTHRIARNRLDALKQRLSECQDINRDYINSVEDFNKSEKAFTEKCEYYKDYQKDVMKHYSVKANVELHEKLQTKEIRLKQIYQEIFRKRQDYQGTIHEVRAGLKDYFELQKSIISQYSRLLFNIRKIGNRQNAQLYIEPIMEEPSDQMNTTTNKVDGPMTNRSERPIDKNIAQERKQIIREEERVVVLERLLNDFLGELKEAIKTAGQNIDQMRESGEYRKFINDKIVMTEILPIDTIRQIDLIVNQISVFRTIILNLNDHFGKFKVLQQISKYRNLNYQKFLEEVSTYLEMEKKGLTLANRQDYNKLQTKFKSRNAELMSRGRERVIELQKAIFGEYYREQIYYSESKNKKNNYDDIFQKPYYQILMHSFFMKRIDNPLYQENPYLKKFSQNLSANMMQNTMTLTNFYKPKKKKGKRNCCGLFSGEDDDEEEDGPSLIEDFHCALKDGLMLIQGKMKLYENYLCFISMFNSKTLFGYSDIRIPKWDILQILSDSHLLSLKIVVETKFGNLQFTSFVTNPYDILAKLYETKKNGFSTFHKNGEGETQAGMLEERFQSQFQGELLKVNIVVDKLSTYLSEDQEKLSISIEYHLNGSSSHSLFQIKVLETPTSIEYVFIHDEHCRNNDIKTLLENVSKELINRKKSSEKTNRLHEIGKEENIQCSIIECNEKNKLSFHKEPSFIKGIQNQEGEIHLEDVRFSQISFGPLLTSRNFIEGEKNPELDNRMASPTIRQSLVQSEPYLDNILLNTGRTSGTSENREEKQMILKSPLIEKKRQTLESPVEEPKRSLTGSKRSGASKVTIRSKTAAKGGSQPNYQVVVIIVAVVLLLNVLCKLLL